jgi:DNA-binding PadR family transcriptional regulator
MPTARRQPAVDTEPLSSVEWQILLALADQPKHGYAILVEIEEREGERARILPGSLYRALHRLEGERWIVATEAPAEETADSRRRVFMLTAKGRRVAQAEADRLAAELRAARRKGLLAERGSS